MRALASPASLKGVLSARRGRRPLSPGGLRRAGAEAEELPRRRRRREGHRACCRGARRRVGTRRCPIRSAGRVGALVRALADGTVVVEAAEAIAARPRASSTRWRASSRGLGELIAARWARPARCSSASAARRPWTAAPACSRCSTTLPAPTTVALRRPRHPAGGAAALRAAEGRARRRRGGARGAARGCPTARRSRRCPARARPAGSARRSPRSAPSSCPAPRYVLDAIGFRERAAGCRSRRHRRGHGRPHHGEGKAPGRGARSARSSASAASCSAAGSSVRASRRSPLSGDPGSAHAAISRS